MSIKIENVDIFGLEAAIRGARNPMNSWEKSDSRFFDRSYENEEHPFGVNVYHDISKNRMEVLSENDEVIEGTLHVIGPNDYKLLMNLCKGGSEESKWRRMVHVQMDIIAPLYWWKEFDTYKIGTVSDSTSTMYKIHAKEFTLEDFSYEHLIDYELYSSNEIEVLIDSDFSINCGLQMLDKTAHALNFHRTKFLENGDKKYWWQMIQLLPTSYNQLRTIDLNYEVLATQYKHRKEHKLDEWREYCEWIKSLPYSEFITGEVT